MHTDGRKISVEISASPADLTLLAKAFTDQYLKQEQHDGRFTAEKCQEPDNGKGKTGQV